MTYGWKQENYGDNMAKFTYCDENISTKFKCPICFEPLDPVTHKECGNTFCKLCVSSLDKCPTCRAKVDITHFVSTKIVKSFVDALKVKCLQCNTVTTRGEFDIHIQK